jgi:hypothetical protein
MKVSDTSIGDDAGQVARIEGETCAPCSVLIAAEGRLRP